MEPFGVKVARGAYGSIAKMRQRPTHAARWAFQSPKVGQVDDRFITDR
jgi:hypothetical protein